MPFLSTLPPSLVPLFSCSRSARLDRSLARPASHLLHASVGLHPPHSLAPLAALVLTYLPLPSCPWCCLPLLAARPPPTRTPRSQFFVAVDTDKLRGIHVRGIDVRDPRREAQDRPLDGNRGGRPEKGLARGRDADVELHRLSANCFSASVQIGDLPLITGGAPRRLADVNALALGDRIDVRWRGGQWYSGRVEERDPRDGQHRILYDDGDVKWHELGTRHWRHVHAQGMGGGANGAEGDEGDDNDVRNVEFNIVVEDDKGKTTVQKELFVVDVDRLACSRIVVCLLRVAGKGKMKAVDAYRWLLPGLHARVPERGGAQ